VHREVRLAGEATAAAVGSGHRRLVVGEPALLRRLAARADLGVLAASATHLPPPNAGADVAADGRARAGPGHLWAFRRREGGRGRPHLLPGGGEARRLIRACGVVSLMLCCSAVPLPLDTTLVDM